ncbi:MAG TPA: hypothetical protein VHM31_12405 [Polyangia bacterium]|nr:hypothetical protein [Polyangia bacterium]
MTLIAAERWLHAQQRKALGASVSAAAATGTEESWAQDSHDWRVDLLRQAKMDSNAPDWHLLTEAELWEPIELASEGEHPFQSELATALQSISAAHSALCPIPLQPTIAGALPTHERHAAVYAPSGSTARVIILDWGLLSALRESANLASEALGPEGGALPEFLGALDARAAVRRDPLYAFCWGHVLAALGDPARRPPFRSFKSQHRALQVRRRVEPATLLDALVLVVLAHEAAHVALNHSASPSLGTAARLQFEREADGLAIAYLMQVGMHSEHPDDAGSLYLFAFGFLMSLMTQLASCDRVLVDAGKRIASPSTHPPGTERLIIGLETLERLIAARPHAGVQFVNALAAGNALGNEMYNAAWGLTKDLLLRGGEAAPASPASPDDARLCYL